MNKYYSKYTKKDNYSNNKTYNNRKSYYNKNNHYNNNYNSYKRRKKIYHDTYEEEISYEKETTFSTKAPSTRDGSFSKSSNSTSRKHSYCEYNNDKIENYNTPLIILDNNKLEKSEIGNFQKINLSENELKTAYFKPKNYKENNLIKTENENKENQENNENIVILEINVKISKDKNVDFKLRKYDDMFQVIKQTCIDNEINEDLINFFGYTIIKALNSIYGIYNLKLKEEEIKYLKKIKEKCEKIEIH